MGKISKSGIVLGIVLVLVVGFVIWNGSADTKEGAPVTTSSITTPATTTSTLPPTTTTTIDLEKTILCEMLDKEYCQSGTLEQIYDGSYIGFNVPSGTPIHSPRDGRATFIFNGDIVFSIGISEGDVEYSEAKNIFEIVYTNDESKTMKSFIKKGEVVATAGEKKLSFTEFNLNKYNLIFLFRKDGKSGDILDINKVYNLGLTISSDKVQSATVSTVSP